MIPLTFLYDEYIDRPKFTEQKKKNPFEYIVPSPTSGVGTTRLSKLGVKFVGFFTRAKNIWINLTIYCLVFYNDGGSCKENLG